MGGRRVKKTGGERGVDDYAKRLYYEIEIIMLIMKSDSELCLTFELLLTLSSYALRFESFQINFHVLLMALCIKNKYDEV